MKTKRIWIATEEFLMSGPKSTQEIYAYLKDRYKGGVSMGTLNWGLPRRFECLDKSHGGFTWGLK